MKSYRIKGDHSEIDLRYFVNWNYPLWIPAVKSVVGDPGRFDGKRVLEIGCGDGRMSCLFGLLGATVLGVDVESSNLLDARKEVERWHLLGRVAFGNYNGDPSTISGAPYDFVFTKSVLVIIPNLERYLFRLQNRMGSGGELLLVENLAQGTALRRAVRRIRRLINKRTWGRDPYFNFHGIDAAFLTIVNSLFDIVEFKKHYGLVASIRAQKR